MTKHNFINANKTD